MNVLAIIGLGVAAITMVTFVIEEGIDYHQYYHLSNKRKNKVARK